MDERQSMVIAERDGVVLREATEADLARVDEITVTCYSPIHDSYVEIVGEECYNAIRRHPELDWKVEKANRVREAFTTHSSLLWILEDADTIFGFVTFALFPEQNRAWIEENGILPERRGQGWATFMLRHVLQYLRQQGIRFVSVEVDLDDAHIPARRAYQAVGFDRHHHIAIYHQDLDRHNPGSKPEAQDDGIRPNVPGPA